MGRPPGQGGPADCFANGETTAVIVAACEDGLSGASVGDSAAWLVRDDGFESLTAGQHHKPLLGSGHAKPVPFERPALAENTLLLASDGLVKYAPPGRICDVARRGDLDAAAAALVDLVRLRSGQSQDDVAVILCRRRRSNPTPPAPGRKRYTLSNNDLREEDAD